MSRKLRRYDAESITVIYDAKRCIRAGECARGLPRVFDPGRRVWVDAKQASAAEIADVVQRCPTGALHFLRKDGGAQEPTPGRNEVWITADGPLYLRGELEVRTPTGVLKETRAALCRCGASRNKPFCDDSHQAIAFRASGGLSLPVTARETGAGPLHIMPVADGPCLIEGPLILVSGDRTKRAACGPRTAFCRCGYSRNKPFCDGSHLKAGFQGT
jgi:CDGSH-type Zn-finger protein/uncharacterized Fe-S cluster protein YjdI